jgi:transcriptional regulator with XRE-family HTH domain
MASTPRPMNRAKQLRIDRQLNLGDVIKGAGVAPKTLTKVEAGEDVHPAALARLSAFYGIKASELFAPAYFAAPDSDAA